jgi:hypothetical protein
VSLSFGDPAQRAVDKGLFPSANQNSAAADCRKVQVFQKLAHPDKERASPFMSSEIEARQDLEAGPSGELDAEGKQQQLRQQQQQQAAIPGLRPEGDQLGGQAARRRGKASGKEHLRISHVLP